MNEQSRWEKLLEDVQTRMKQDPVDEAAVARLLKDQDPAEVALVLEELEPEAALRAFRTLEDSCAAQVLAVLAPDLTGTITAQLAPDVLTEYMALLPDRDAAALLSEQSKRAVEEAADSSRLDARVAREAVQQQCYPEGTVGRLMTSRFVRLHPDMRIQDALMEVRRSDPEINIPNDMFVVDRPHAGSDGSDRLLGVISIRDALMQPRDSLVADVMQERVVSVAADTESTSAARLLSKHRFMSLPVTDEDGFLVGVAPSEDLMQVTIAQLYQRYSRAVGTDAAAMEAMSPLQAAKARVP